MLSQEKAVPLHTLYKTCKAIGDPLAQLVEHNTFNVGVLGSSPKRITNQTPEILDLWISGVFHVITQYKSPVFHRILYFCNTYAIPDCNTKIGIRRKKEKYQ